MCGLSSKEAEIAPSPEKKSPPPKRISIGECRDASNKILTRGQCRGQRLADLLVTDDGIKALYELYNNPRTSKFLKDQINKAIHLRLLTVAS